MVEQYYQGDLTLPPKVKMVISILTLHHGKYLVLKHQVLGLQDMILQDHKDLLVLMALMVLMVEPSLMAQEYQIMAMVQMETSILILSIMSYMDLKLVVYGGLLHL